MTGFVIRRVLFGLLVLWVITIVVFGLFFVAPRDPARLIAGRQANQQTVALVAHRLGLDQPLPIQYLSFLGRLVHGDLGYSYYSSEPVTSLIAQRVPVDISLAVGSALIWLVIGVAIGVLASRRPRSLPDRLATVLALVFYSMPTFLLGELFLLVLFYLLTVSGLGIFPGSGYVALTQDPFEWFRHLVLPWLTLALVMASVYVRLTRASMLDVLGEDYIRTARSKGITEGRVVYRHALRAAMTPVVTQFGIDLGVLLGGAVVTENVFGLPGIGQLAVLSIVTQDRPVIIGVVILASAAVVGANIVVDALYAVLDPRVRLA